MCKCVGEQTQLGPVMQSGAVPSDKDLQTYREMVARLEQTKVPIDKVHPTFFLSCLSVVEVKSRCL